MATDPKSVSRKAKSHTGWKSRYLGSWRIIWMDQFDRKDLDGGVPAHITLEKGGHGNFEFLLVYGEMEGDYKSSFGGGECMFDFTWAGNDECDEAFGDGRMAFLSDSKAEGEIRFHYGDTYKFRALKKTGRSHRKR